MAEFAVIGQSEADTLVKWPNKEHDMAEIS